VLIREERPTDSSAIREILTGAFGRDTEARLVERLRAAGKTSLSMVAEERERLLGHVLFSPIVVERAEQRFVVMALAPLAVVPAFQRLGIGSALVSAGLARVKTISAAGVLVIGEPKYYARFGFLPASRFNIRCPFPDAAEYFMALELTRGSLKGCAGIACYGHEFDDLE
jgi:putative acetyltransferase